MKSTGYQCDITQTMNNGYGINVTLRITIDHNKLSRHRQHASARLKNKALYAT